MTALPASGQVRIAVTLAAGAIQAVEIACDRPHGLTALLARLPLDAVPVAIGRLYGLCALSQRGCAAAALAAASGRAPALLPLARLAAERLGALLRASLIDFAPLVPLASVEQEAARALLAAAAAVAAGATADPAAVQAALDRLGLREKPADGWAGRLRASLADLAGPEPAPLDPLTAADDEAVLAALDREGESFAARPALPGRRPQTGPLARAVAAGRTPAEATDPAARLAARWEEITAAADLLTSRAEAGAAGWLRAGTLAPGLGFAALESPRGRLHHLIALDRQGRLARCAILAPTEWAFAPGGPFAAALPQVRLIPGQDPRAAIDRLAALYDPCVARHVTLSDARAGAPPDA